MTDYARSFRDLRVYQKAINVECAVFDLSKTFPRDELYSLTNQVRRSSRSIGAQITEAWAKRRYPAHFVSKLTDSDAEQQETQHWLECAQRAKYVQPPQIVAMLADLNNIGRMLNGMMLKAEWFCTDDPRRVREMRGEYFVENPSDHGLRDTDNGSSVAGA